MAGDAVVVAVDPKPPKPVVPVRPLPKAGFGWVAVDPNKLGVVVADVKGVVPNPVEGVVCPKPPKVLVD